MQWARNSAGTGHGTGALATGAQEAEAGKWPLLDEPTRRWSERLRSTVCPPAQVQLPGPAAWKRLYQHWVTPPQGLKPPVCSQGAHKEPGPAPRPPPTGSTALQAGAVGEANSH